MLLMVWICDYVLGALLLVAGGLLLFLVGFDCCLLLVWLCCYLAVVVF